MKTLDRSGEHKGDLPLPDPYKQSSIWNILPFYSELQKEHSQHLKLLGLNSKTVIARGYFVEIVYSF